MTDQLVAFVHELDQNPELQQKYKADPKGTMEAFGVSDKDIDLVFGDDTEALKNRLEMAGLHGIVWVNHSK